MARNEYEIAYQARAALRRFRILSWIRFQRAGRAEPAPRVPGRELRCAFAALTDPDHLDVFPEGRAGKIAK